MFKFIKSIIWRINHRFRTFMVRRLSSVKEQDSYFLINKKIIENIDHISKKQKINNNNNELDVIDGGKWGSFANITVRTFFNLTQREKDVLKFYMPKSPSLNFKYIYSNIDDRTLHCNVDESLFKNENNNKIKTFTEPTLVIGGHVFSASGYIIQETNSNPFEETFVSGMNNFKVCESSLTFDAQRKLIKDNSEFSIGKFGLVFGKSYQNLHHCLIDYAPKIEHLISQKKVKIILPHDLPSAVADFCLITFGPNNFIKMNTNHGYIFNNLSLCRGDFISGDSMKSWLNSSQTCDLNTLRILREKFLENFKPNLKYKNQKIYLRRRSNTSRGIILEPIIHLILKIMGFKNIYMEDLSLTDQVSIFRNSSIVLGVGGAAFAWLFLAEKNVRFIYLISSINRDYRHISDIAKVGEVKTKMILGSKPKYVKNMSYLDYFHGRFFVNPISIIKEVLRCNRL